MDFKKIFICLVLLCYMPLIQAVSSSKKLSTITNKIQILKQDLSKSQTQYTHIKNTLAKTEINIGKLSHQIKTTQTKIKSQEKLLVSAQQKQNNYQQQLTTQKTYLTQQLENAYELGRQPYLKLLLNQQNPETISRYLHYYQYLCKARVQAIQNINQLSEQINQNTKTIQSQTSALKKTYSTQKQQKINLKQQQKERQNLLVQTRHEISGKNAELNKLLEDKKQLENVIESSKTFAAPGGTFSASKGKLPWPVTGRIVQYFGQPLMQGRLHSTGILIQTDTGKSVQAVFSGKVVFANWLRGFGLLIIIQHGSNYLTLYARNQSIYVKSGQMVLGGQTIATTGNSGGFETNGLYFEIRHNSSPLNPTSWLNKK